MDNDDRRSSNKKWHFDKSINLGNILAILVLAATLVKVSSTIVEYLVDTNTKISIMWVKFARDNPDIIKMYGMEKSK